MATTEAAYRIDGARHIYLNHPERIHDGLLPPFLHAIAGVRTTIDTHGRVSRIEITREPAVAREVLPWIERLIRAAEPYPRPPAGLDTVRWDEIWLIDRSGRFQLHTLSEGQQQALYVHGSPVSGWVRLDGGSLLVVAGIERPSTGRSMATGNGSLNSETYAASAAGVIASWCSKTLCRPTRSSPF